MKERVIISKDDEKAIIMCLEAHQGVFLPSAKITNYVKKYIKVNNDNNMYRKIQRMKEKGYLISKEEKRSRHLYSLNPDMEFVREGPDLKLLVYPKEGAASHQMLHTSQLKEAVKIWMDGMVEPDIWYHGSKGSGNAVIADCESHLLFPDLENHLPGLGIDVCEKWSKYKEDLLRLDELKTHLYSSLEGDILRCFDGLKLKFVSEDESYLSVFECSLTPMSLYKIVMRLESDDDGYYEYQSFLSWLELNSPVVDDGDFVAWGEVIPHMRLPIRYRNILCDRINVFLEYLRNIQSSEYMEIAAKITKRIDELKPKRENVLRDLEKAMLYSNFPGECEYLKDD